LVSQSASQSVGLELHFKLVSLFHIPVCACHW